MTCQQNMIDAAHLRDILHYDPETGIFTWRRVLYSSGRPKDRPAGRPSRRYSQITIRYRRYLAHRLAFLYMTGEWPPSGLEVDHNQRQRLRQSVRQSAPSNTLRKYDGRLPAPDCYHFCYPNSVPGRPSPP
jgi:hypothetical protein